MRFCIDFPVPKHRKRFRSHRLHIRRGAPREDGTLRKLIQLNANENVHRRDHTVAADRQFCMARTCVHYATGMHTS